MGPIYSSHLLQLLGPPVYVWVCMDATVQARTTVQHGTRSGSCYGACAVHGVAWAPTWNRRSMRGVEMLARANVPALDIPYLYSSALKDFRSAALPTRMRTRYFAPRSGPRGADWDDIPCRVPPLGAGRTDDGSSASACHPMGDGRWLIHRCSKLDGARATDRLATRDTDQPNRRPGFVVVRSMCM
jgi:hypothetical protein